MKRIVFILCCLLGFASLQAQSVPSEKLYGLGSWDADSLGNHRVVVAVDKAGRSGCKC